MCLQGCSEAKPPCHKMALWVVAAGTEADALPLRSAVVFTRRCGAATHGADGPVPAVCGYPPLEGLGVVPERAAAQIIT